MKAGAGPARAAVEPVPESRQAVQPSPADLSLHLSGAVPGCCALETATNRPVPASAIAPIKAGVVLMGCVSLKNRKASHLAADGSSAGWNSHP